MQRHGRIVGRPLHLHVDTALVGVLVGSIGEPPLSLIQPGPLGAAELAFDAGIGRDDVDGLGSELDLTARTPRVRPGLGDRLDGEHRAGSGTPRVGADIHRGRACVVLASGEERLEVVDAGDGLNDADLSAHPLQFGPLLDVEFEEGSDLREVVACVEESLGIDAGIRQSLGEAAAAGVGGGQGGAVDESCHRPGADAEEAEVIGLFVEEDHDDEVMVESDVVLPQQPHDLDGTEDTGDSVESATAVDGVRVGPEHDLTPAEATGQDSDDVSGPVDSGLQPCLLHQGAGVVAAGDVEFAQRSPRPSGPLRVDEGGQRRQLG